MKIQLRSSSSSLSCLAIVLGVTATLFCGNELLAKPGKDKGHHDDKGKGVGRSADFVPPGHRRAPVEIVVKHAPPAVRVETKSARPSAGHVWVAGYWTWESSAYAWTPAVWIMPPEPKAVWVLPRFESRSGINFSISGYWRL